MGCKRIFGVTLSMGIAAERTYHGNDLGAVYSAESTTFRVWAPSAELVILRRYSTGSDTEDGASDKQTDAMVWEVHVRDFSSSPDSGMENKGKYLAFMEKNTTVNGEGGLSTGVSYLKELGVNYVQLLPVFDYVNDETDESNLSYD